MCSSWVLEKKVLFGLHTCKRNGVIYYYHTRKEKDKKAV